MNEVHSPKKPLIFYYMVAMLLVMLFNFIAMPWLSQYQIQEVDYNTFVSMTEKGEIGRAEIQEADNRILFTSKDEKTIYKTAMISTDSQLVQRLLDAGVSTSGEEIEQTSKSMLVSIPVVKPSTKYSFPSWNRRFVGRDSESFMICSLIAPVAGSTSAMMALKESKIGEML